MQVRKKQIHPRSAEYMQVRKKQILISSDIPFPEPAHRQPATLAQMPDVVILRGIPNQVRRVLGPGVFPAQPGVHPRSAEYMQVRKKQIHPRSAEYMQVRKKQILISKSQVPDCGCLSRPCALTI